MAALLAALAGYGRRAATPEGIKWHSMPQRYRSRRLRIGDRDHARITDDRQKFATRRRIGSERAEHARGDHRDAGLMYATCRHALMCGFENHADAFRLQHVVQRVG